MSFLNHCPNCGEPSPSQSIPETVVVCPDCMFSYRVPGSATPEPHPGPLIMSVGLNMENIPGWRFVNKEKLQIEDGLDQELIATFKAGDLYYPVLRTISQFDDFDFSTNIRFIKGDHDYCHAGVEIRSGDHGDYIVSLSPQGTFRLGWHKGTDWGGVFSPWRDHSAVNIGWNEVNRLRIQANQNQFRLYLNGVFAASITDDQYTGGLIRLVIAPKKKKTIVGFSQIELREFR